MQDFIDEVSDKLDFVLSEIVAQNDLQNIEWNIEINNQKNEFTQLNDKVIKFSIDDYGTGGSVKTTLGREEFFYSAAKAGPNFKNLALGVSQFVAIMVMNNLAASSRFQIEKMRREGAFDNKE